MPPTTRKWPKPASQHNFLGTIKQERVVDDAMPAAHVASIWRLECSPGVLGDSVGQSTPDVQANDAILQRGNGCIYRRCRGFQHVGRGDQVNAQRASDGVVAERDGVLQEGNGRLSIKPPPFQINQMQQINKFSKIYQEVFRLL